MTLLEKIALKRAELQKELDALSKEEKKIISEKYDKYIGKCYYHIGINCYIKVKNINIEDYFVGIRGLIYNPTYNDTFQYIFNKYSTYHLKFGEYLEDIGFEEISEQDFIQTFYETIGQAITDFNTIIFNKQ